MKMNQFDLDGDVLKVALDGSLDIMGSAAIDGRFETIALEQDRLVVDLAGVDFLASIGIRVLVKAAKTIANRGGRMAVYNAQEMCRKVLESTGVNKIIRLVESEDDALAAVRR